MGVSWLALEQGRKARPVAKEIERQFPGVRVWYGSATAAWWALLPTKDGPRLLEAVDSAQLRESIINVRRWPWRHR